MSAQILAEMAIERHIRINRLELEHSIELDLVVDYGTENYRHDDSVIYAYPVSIMWGSIQIPLYALVSIPVEIEHISDGESARIPLKFLRKTDVEWLHDDPRGNPTRHIGDDLMGAVRSYMESCDILRPEEK